MPQAELTPTPPAAGLGVASFEPAMQTLRRAMCALHSDDSAWLDVDLTMAQTKALMAVAVGGAIHGRTVAESLGVGQPAASRLVEHLVGRGYVRREEDPEDRRMICLRLTESGQALHDRLTGTGREALRALLAALDAEELARVIQAWEILARAAERVLSARGAAAPHAAHH